VRAAATWVTARIQKLLDNFASWDNPVTQANIFIIVTTNITTPS